MVLLEIYPAPIELLNKLLSLLGDPEYIEVGVWENVAILRCSPGLAERGVSLVAC